MKTPAGSCPSIQDDLVAFREGGLEGPRILEIRLHLRFCAACRDQWSELEELDRWIEADLEAPVRPGFADETVALMSPRMAAPPAVLPPAVLPPAGSKRASRRAAVAIPILGLAASFLIAAIFYFEAPAPTLSEPASAAFHSLPSDGDFLEAGRLMSGGGAGDLALPLPPTDGIRRVARILAAR